MCKKAQHDKCSHKKFEGNTKQHLTLFFTLGNNI